MAILHETSIAVDFFVKELKPEFSLFITNFTEVQKISIKCSVYCSEETATLLKRNKIVSSSLIKVLSLGKTNISINYKDEWYVVRVTTIKSKHCVGSLMFLFEGFFGKVLYTGSFVYFPALYQSIRNERGRKTIDTVYFDNTFAEVDICFPTLQVCLIDILKLIRTYKEVVIALDSYFLKCEFVVAIANQLHQKIYVEEELYEILLQKKYPVEHFSRDDVSCSIHVQPLYFFREENYIKHVLTTGKKIIIPTTIDFETRAIDHIFSKKIRGVHVVPYPLHPTYAELEQFFRYIR